MTLLHYQLDGTDPDGQYAAHPPAKAAFVLADLSFTGGLLFHHLSLAGDAEVSTNVQDLPRLSMGPGASLIQGSPFMPLWENEASPALGLAGESEFETTSFLAWGRRGWQVAMIISGSLDSLPPRHLTPPPRTTLPDVRELDRDTADARVVDAGLVPRYDLKLWIGSGDGSAAYLPG